MVMLVLGRGAVGMEYCGVAARADGVERFPAPGVLVVAGLLAAPDCERQGFERLFIAER